MVDQEELRKRALRAYEFGRLRMSSRVLLFLLPLGVACVVLSDNRKVCAFLALLIGGLAVTLRWLHRRGVQAVEIGLKAAMLPLAVSIALMQWGHSSSPALAVSVCSVAGALAGAWTGYQLGRARAGALVWLSSASVALVAAALGAVDLGAGGLVGLSVSYIASGTVAAFVARLRAPQVSLHG